MRFLGAYRARKRVRSLHEQNEDRTIWDMKGAWICTNKIFSFQAPNQRDTALNALIFDKFDEIILIGSYVPLIKLSESIKKSDTSS